MALRNVTRLTGAWNSIGRDFEVNKGFVDCYCEEGKIKDRQYDIKGKDSERKIKAHLPPPDIPPADMTSAGYEMLGNCEPCHTCCKPLLAKQKNRMLGKEGICMQN